MSSKNDKWSMFKNYMHNELGITKEDIREWLDEAIKEEARKMVENSFNSYSIKNRIDDAIKEFDVFGSNGIKYELARQISNRIIECLEFNIKTDEKV